MRMYSNVLQKENSNCVFLNLFEVSRVRLLHETIKSGGGGDRKRGQIFSVQRILSGQERFYKNGLSEHSFKSIYLGLNNGHYCQNRKFTLA